jgi:hypothetical protein
MRTKKGRSIFREPPFAGIVRYRLMILLLLAVGVLTTVMV